jgi:hypothetical protein
MAWQSLGGRIILSVAFVNMGMDWDRRGVYLLAWHC